MYSVNAGGVASKVKDSEIMRLIEMWSYSKIPFTVEAVLCLTKNR